MNPHLDLLLSVVYDRMPLHPDHAADLAKSGITAETIRMQKIRSAPPAMIGDLLGFKAPSVLSAYLLPFADPRGGWLDHVRLRTFPELDEIRGDHVEAHREKYRYNSGRRKYLTRRRAVPRLFFPLATMAAALQGPDDLWICEGPKKALALAQTGVPVVAIESAWGWHHKGARDLLPDFDLVTLRGRTVKLCPDPDAQTNPEIARAMQRLATALGQRGARVLVGVFAEVA